MMGKDWLKAVDEVAAGNHEQEDEIDDGRKLQSTEDHGLQPPRCIKINTNRCHFLYLFFILFLLPYRQMYVLSKPNKYKNK